MKNLSTALGKLFSPQKVRTPDTQRTARQKAKALAGRIGCEIERVRFDGRFFLNVWPPKTLCGEDPYEGDHHCNDWVEALQLVEGYAKQRRCTDCAASD